MWWWITVRAEPCPRAHFQYLKSVEITRLCEKHSPGVILFTCQLEWAGACCFCVVCVATAGALSKRSSCRHLHPRVMLILAKRAAAEHCRLSVGSECLMWSQGNEMLWRLGSFHRFGRLINILRLLVDKLKIGCKYLCSLIAGGTPIMHWASLSFSFSRAAGSKSGTIQLILLL